MYDAIRQLIRENRLRKAIYDMGNLKLSREHASRLVTLDRRLHILENKKIGNLTEDRLIIIEENGLVEDMLVFLDQVEFPQRNPAHREAGHTGAGAGAVNDRKKSKSAWLGIAASVIALLTIAFLLWPEADSTKGTPARESSVAVPAEQPSGTLTDEERKKEALRLEDEKKKEDLRQQELLRERQRRLEEKRKEAEAAATTAFMTSGAAVDMAVAVYSGPENTTKLDVFLTKNLSSYLSKAVAEKSASAVALTPEFHNSKERELLVFGRMRGDKRLSPRRARYVVLADVRNVDGSGKAELRMCIYDSASGMSMTRQGAASVGTSPQMKEKDILYAVRAFLEEKLRL